MWRQAETQFQEAFQRVADAVARLLPIVLAMSLIALLTVPLAALARWLVRRVCSRIDLDRRLREWGMAQPSAVGRTSPSDSIARLIWFTVLLLGCLLGLSVLEPGVTSTFAIRLLEYVPRTLVGVALFAAGLAGSRAAERSVLIGAVNMGLQSARMLGLGARWLVLVLAIAMALERLGLGGTILTTFFAILFGGIVLTLALAIGLGAREAVARSLERHAAALTSDVAPAEAAAGKSAAEVHHL